MTYSLRSKEGLKKSRKPKLAAAFQQSQALGLWTAGEAATRGLLGRSQHSQGMGIECQAKRLHRKGMPFGMMPRKGLLMLYFNS